VSQTHGASLFHILPREVWYGLDKATTYRPPSLASEGFIHLSTADQLLRTAARHFAGRTDLVVIAIDPAKLEAPLRYAHAHGEAFPHLHGPLPMRAVTAVEPLPLVDGEFVFPKAWTK
jgi:uncharacterized protein (DUF952 family)